MRNDPRARAVLLLGIVLAAGACTTTQPDSVGTRTASVHIGIKALVTIHDCYEIWAADIDGVFVYQGFNECYPRPQSENTERPIPWHYSLVVSVIRKGETNEELATSLSGVIGTSLLPGDGIDDFISMTDYDPSDQPADPRANEDRPGYGTIQFRNGKRVSRGSPFYLAPSGFELGFPNILSLSPSFDFEVNSGDTVIVRARKRTVADSEHFLQASPAPKITMTGSLFVGGALITPTGTTISTDADGAGISFAFTVQ